MKKSLSFSVSSIARNLILLFLISHSSFLTAQPCGTPVPYNGYTYNTVQVGSYCWMTDNLRTTVDATGNPIAVALIYQSNMHPDTVANLAAFGRLYSWYSAVGLPEGSTQKPTVNAAGYVQGICPNGWYLPTQEAFDELHAFAIEALCSDNPAYWLGHIMNNSTDLSFVPGGYYHPNSSMYNHLLGDAYYWISDTTLSTTKPMCHILYGCPVLELGTVNAHTGYSVRCVQKIPLEVTCPLSGDTAVSQNSGANYKHTGTGWDATTPTAGATLSYTLSGATTGSGTTLDNVTFNPGLTTVTWKATMGEKADSCSFTVHVTSKLKTCTDCEGDITVMDIDGNIYQAKTMPDGRVWMIENLRTTKYANGDAIREWTNEWITADNGNYKPYFVMPSKANLGAFTSDKDTLWGYYYNWAAAMGLASDDNGQGITTDQGLVQGICPAGWHLPSQKERDTLIQRIAGIGITLGSTTDSSAVRMACTNSGWNNGYLTNSGSARQNETCFFCRSCRLLLRRQREL
ncbi:fibrobacter succinogenes major paralogous domain-containing protein [Bacteroidales bacterium OttesenSCG-928-L19]|nr:fibrobacter succinogenes major paralogous domain-containing protein [Bacteroidales bacterium OttesenSCG-928-L19]